MTEEPFFHRDGDRYIPTESARGFWTPQSLNGRVIVGILGFELERLYGQEGWQPARLTVDMFRLPKREPVEIATHVVRDGKRLRLVDAEFRSGGVAMGRASCQFLKRTANTPGEYWNPPAWDAPPPATLEPVVESRPRYWDRRPIPPTPGARGPRRLWLRETRELVDGFPLTPFTRVAVSADMASPMANSGREAVGYINSDVTIYLHRSPATEWVGFELVSHHASEGVAVGECWLHDERGAIGSATVAAVAQVRRD